MANTESTTDVLTLREGDVYRFSYSDEARAKWRTDPYWCFDGQVVVRDGQLVDTYWGGLKGYGDSRVVKPTDGTLTFVCNLGDVREIQEYERHNYAEADVFNLSSQHWCHKQWFVRKDAGRSAEAMVAWLREESRKTRSDIDLAMRRLERLAEQRIIIERGDTSISIG